MNIPLESNSRFKIRRADVVVISLLVIKLVLLAAFFPELEMPDEEFHYRTITGYYKGDLLGGFYCLEEGGVSIYSTLMHKVYAFLKSFNLRDCPNPALNPHFSFGSNSFLFMHEHFNCPIGIFLKLFQVSIVVGFLSVLYYCLKYIKNISEEDKSFIFRLNLLYFSWPAVSSSLTGLSSDFAVYLYEALFFIILVHYNKFRLLFIINALILLFFDLNPIIMLAMLLVYMCYYFISKPEKSIFSKSKKYFLVLLGLGAILFYSFLMKAGVIAKILPSLGEDIRQTYVYGYHPIRSLGAIFLSSYYLGGSMSLLASGVEYAIFSVFLIIFLKDIFEAGEIIKNRIFLYVISGFVTVNIVLLTLPTLKQGRLYYFLIPVFIAHFFLKKRNVSSVVRYVLGGALFFIISIIHLTQAASRAFIKA